ncbi:hypothetical protein UFOVP1360_23 [uncultured Caudovirales phage]|uniref:Uncharacterized protein n=1 Tax=uncultured Caudovirales phage TaxID=2100421 RepID=A0A6J5RU51_9CAUD|nr:hypothetical protein UFOVP1360_23 [uncultured Caudovirales phage]
MTEDARVFDSINPATGRLRQYRYSFEPILLRLGMTDAESIDKPALAKLFGPKPGAIARSIKLGLTVWTADRYATILGVGPGDLWPEWWEHAAHDDRRPCECERPVIEPVLGPQPVCDRCGGTHDLIDLHTWLRDTGPIAWSA